MAPKRTGQWGKPGTAQTRLAARPSSLPWPAPGKRWKSKQSKTSCPICRASVINAHGFPEHQEGEAAEPGGRITPGWGGRQVGDVTGVLRKRGRYRGPQQPTILVTTLAVLPPSHVVGMTTSVGPSRGRTGHASRGRAGARLKSVGTRTAGSNPWGWRCWPPGVCGVWVLRRSSLINPGAACNASIRCAYAA
jgi:hypothetical protein